MTITQWFEPPTPVGVRRNFVCDFSDNLDTGEIIASATVTVVPDDAFTLSGAPVIGRVDADGRNFMADSDGPCVLQTLVAGGVAINDVVISFRATTSANQTPEGDFYATIAPRS